MSLFWVVGGEYTDTHFQETVGSKEQWFGPFRDYLAAKEEWDKHAKLRKIREAPRRATDKPGFGFMLSLARRVHR